MGSTLTAAIIEGDRIAVAQVGDSRAYLYHSDQLERVTEDHSMIADMIRQGTLTEKESRTHPNRSVITRALGSDPNMYADTYEVSTEPGDRLLLCSDGLTTMLVDSQIAEILDTYRDPETAARALVDAANAAGGHDNISVIIAVIEGDPSADHPSSSRSWMAGLIWLFAALVLVLGAVWGTYSYAASQAYVVDEAGTVTLYRGIPGKFAGFTLKWAEEETTITVRALGPTTAARLAQGIQIENVDAGYELLEEYRSMAEPSSEATTEPTPETP